MLTLMCTSFPTVEEVFPVMQYLNSYITFACSISAQKHESYHNHQKLFKLTRIDLVRCFIFNLNLVMIMIDFCLVQCRKVAVWHSAQEKKPDLKFYVLPNKQTELMLRFNCYHDVTV